MKTLHTLMDEASGCSSSADRMSGWDTDVIKLSMAKGLIGEAYVMGMKMMLASLRRRGDSCNCADHLESVINSR